MPLRAITFDVGHTIIFPHPSLGHRYASAAERQGITMAPGEAEQRFMAAWKQARETQTGLVYGTNHEEARSFWRRVIDIIFVDDGVSSVKRAAILNELYEGFATASAWRVDSGWQEAVKACRNAGLRIGLISNWDVRLRDLLTALDITADVDSAVISAEIGIEKPEPAIFMHALAELGVDPQDALHVGDTWEDDIEGACRLGIRTGWVNANPSAPLLDPTLTPHRITSLADIPTLVQAT